MCSRTARLHAGQSRASFPAKALGSIRVTANLRLRLRIFEQSFQRHANGLRYAPVGFECVSAHTFEQVERQFGADVYIGSGTLFSHLFYLHASLEQFPKTVKRSGPVSVNLDVTYNRLYEPTRRVDDRKSSSHAVSLKPWFVSGIQTFAWRG